MNDFNEHNYLCHYGVLGMKWGIRRYQNKDGTLTSEGRHRYVKTMGKENVTALEFKEKSKRSHKLTKEQRHEGTVKILSSREDTYEEAIKFDKARKKWDDAVSDLDKRIKNAKTDKQMEKLQSLKEYSMDFPGNQDADKKIRKAAIEREKARRDYVQKLVGSNLSDIDMRRVHSDVASLSNDELGAVQEIIKHNLHRSDIGANLADEIEKRNKVNIALHSSF